MNAVPDAPDVLFADWLLSAIEFGAPEPHAMTLSTVDECGRPNARVLILKDLAGGRWQFASSELSAKGQELAKNPMAALTFYWPSVGRQVRVRGEVSHGSRDDAGQDYLARPAGSRALAWAGQQSNVLGSETDLAEALGEASVAIDETPDAVPSHWHLYSLSPHVVEFWQADKLRRHLRLQYRNVDGKWRKLRLWP